MYSISKALSTEQCTWQRNTVRAVTNNINVKIIVVVVIIIIIMLIDPKRDRESGRDTQRESAVGTRSPSVF